MRAHRNDVYRARRSRGKVWPVLLWILAGLIVLAVILFYAGQKYIVYGSDGSLHVVFPIMETPAPVTDDGQPETVDTELVLEDPDYSGIISDAGKDLSELHAQYLTADKITPEGLTRAAASAKAAGGNAQLEVRRLGGIGLRRQRHGRARRCDPDRQRAEHLPRRGREHVRGLAHGRALRRHRAADRVRQRVYRRLRRLGRPVQHLHAHVPRQPLQGAAGARL